MSDNHILNTNKVLYGYVVGDGRPIPKLLGYLYFYIDTLSFGYEDRNKGDSFKKTDKTLAFFNKDLEHLSEYGVDIWENGNILIDVSISSGTGFALKVNYSLIVNYFTKEISYFISSDYGYINAITKINITVYTMYNVIKRFKHYIVVRGAVQDRFFDVYTKDFSIKNSIYLIKSDSIRNVIIPLECDTVTIRNISCCQLESIVLHKNIKHVYLPLTCIKIYISKHIDFNVFNEKVNSDGSFYNRKAYSLTDLVEILSQYDVTVELY